MDWLDYRKKLGIGFCDKDKFNLFLVKIFNVLNAISQNSNEGCFSDNEYFSFCNLTGSLYDVRISDSCYNRERFQEFLTILDRHRNSLEEFLSYYIAFTNSIEVSKPLPHNWVREHYANLLDNLLNEAHIPIDLIKDGDEYFAFSKGAEELDDALVSQVLEWMSEYPKARKEWISALKEYSDLTDERASDIADKFRKALERFFQEFFNNSKSLETQKSIYGNYMKENGIPAEISNNLETLLQSYTNFMNNYAKHQNRTDKKVLEYIMYQTGNIMRLLITLKQNESEN